MDLFEYGLKPATASDVTSNTSKIGAGVITAFGTTGAAASDLTNAINELAAWSPMNAQLSSVRPKQGATTLDLAGSITANIVGTATSRTMTDTNFLTRRNRLGCVGATAAGSAAGVHMLSLGTGQQSRNTGFQFWTGMGIVAVSAATTRAFVGLAGAGLVPTTNPITATYNGIGMGYDETTANWNLLINDNTGAPLVIPLGASFPKNVPNSVFDVWLGCAQLGSTIPYRVRRLDVPVVFSGTFTSRLPTAGSVLWGNTTMCNGTDAASGVSMDFLGFETALPLA